MREAQVRRLVPILLATWFIAISAMRLILIAPGGPGFDGRLYRSATVAWLNGQDPWAVVQGGVYYGAPPPSLIPMIPFALLPETLGVGLLLVLCVVGSIWAIRRLGLPLWWLAFPPLVDGVWNANPHALVLPLLVAGGAVLGAIAIIIKVYAAVVPAIRLEIRTLLLAGVAIVVTAPFVPWATYLAERQTIQAHLDATAGGGSSVFGLPMPLLADRRGRLGRRARGPRAPRPGAGGVAGDAGVLAVDPVVLLVDGDPGGRRAVGVTEPVVHDAHARRRRGDPRLTGRRGTRARPDRRRVRAADRRRRQALATRGVLPSRPRPRPPPTRP